MNDDAEWEKLGAQVRVVAERLMKAGWVVRTIQTPEGLGIEYTAQGAQKMNELLELLRALDVATMTREDLDTLRAIIRQFADNTGHPI